MSKKRLRAIATVVLSVLLTVQFPLAAESDDEKKKR